MNEKQKTKSQLYNFVGWCESPQGEVAFEVLALLEMLVGAVEPVQDPQSAVLIHTPREANRWSDIIQDLNHSLGNSSSLYTATKSHLNLQVTV